MMSLPKSLRKGCATTGRFRKRREFGLSQPRTDCPASFAGYAGFPYADGDLSQTYVVPPGKEMVPPPYMARLAKVYGLG